MVELWRNRPFDGELSGFGFGGIPSAKLHSLYAIDNEFSARACFGLGFEDFRPGFES